MISHREHRALIWIAERAIQIQLPSSFRWKFTPSGVEYVLIFPLKKSAQKIYLCDLCELERSPHNRESGRDNQMRAFIFLVIAMFVFGSAGNFCIAEVQENERSQKTGFFIDFMDYQEGSIESWLKAKGFEFKLGANNRRAPKTARGGAL